MLLRAVCKSYISTEVQNSKDI